MTSYTKYHKEYYQLNKEKVADNIKKRRLNDAEFRAKVRINTQKWQSKHPESRLFNAAKQRASKKNIEFSITINDIIIPTHCPIMGVELTTETGEGRKQTAASLDRIDNSKGYTKDNIQVISWLANSMKQEATKEQLLAFALGIIKFYA